MLSQYSINKVMYPIHLAFSVDEVQTLMASRNDGGNFGKRHWKKVNETIQNIRI